MSKVAYLVKMTFEIPVLVDDDQSEEYQKIDAYYNAEKEFNDFSPNEAKMTFEKIDMETAKELRKSIARVHNK